MLNFQVSEVNLLAVLVAWIIHIAIGLIWFWPELFGKKWSELTGKELKPAKRWIIPGLIGHLIMSLVLVFLIKRSNTDNGLIGMLIALLSWIGFIVPMQTGELIWEKIPFRLFLIRC